MSTTLTTPLKREVLTTDNQTKTTQLLQKNLVNLIDLGLLLKQAHWNVLGPNFRSVHLQLDEILVSVRDASDEVAERITTLGVTADGRCETVARDSELQSFDSNFQSVPATVSSVADALKTVIDSLRAAITNLGDLDPVSEDLVIGISASLEKHLWMLQSQEA